MNILLCILSQFKTHILEDANYIQLSLKIFYKLKKLLILTEANTILEHKTQLASLCFPLRIVFF